MISEIQTTRNRSWRIDQQRKEVEKSNKIKGKTKNWLRST